MSHKTEIEKIAVIGAGVMGSGIAAQAANAGLDVLLLDIVPPGGEADRDLFAKEAIKRLKGTEPAPLMDPGFSQRITPGNTADHLAKLKECDWIVEVVLEDLEIKRSLYRKIEKYRKPNAIVSSNTSTLPLAILLDGMPDSFRQCFLITHFFNPPRYMALLEVVTGKETSPDLLARFEEFAEQRLGKSVVRCHDTPGFIANRIGAFWMQLAITEAIKSCISVEEADSVLGRPMGVPKTGVFGLLDLIGLDLMPHIMANLKEYLAEDDPYNQLDPMPKLLDRMIADGFTGRKGKGGFYRLNEKRQKEVISLADGSYSLAMRPKIAAAKVAGNTGLRAMMSHNSPAGRYAWRVISGTLVYTALLVPEIADDIESVDRAMRLGYNWRYGPFELLDQIGTKWFAERLVQEGRLVPPSIAGREDLPFYKDDGVRLCFRGCSAAFQTIKRPKGVLLLSDIKRGGKPLMKNRSASLWDIGDKVACLEFHSKMNSLNIFTLTMINRIVKALPNLGYRALVVHNEAKNFSVGANIVMLLISMKLHQWSVIDWILRLGQNAFHNLKYAPFPVVGAPSGMALGGGCEILLHCDKIVAHAETYMGLVETGIGIVPGWGGCKELLGRWLSAEGEAQGPIPASRRAFEIIAMARVAKSAHEGKNLKFLRPDDKIVMNKERVLQRAKEQALKLAKNYLAPQPYRFKLAGPSGRDALEMGVRGFVEKGVASAHDALVGRVLAGVLTGGGTDHTMELGEEDILRLERQALIKLIKTKKSKARIEYILKTGKPLRN